MHILKVCIALFLFVSSESTLAQNVDDVLSRLQRKYDGARDIHARFTQEVRFGVTQFSQTFDGQIWMKRGNKYRVELEHQTIVTDGITVWTYSVQNRQVLIDTFRDDPDAITPDRVLVNVPKNYYSSIVGKERLDRVEHIILRLIPKDDKSLTKSMRVWVNPSQWLMSRIEVVDVGDNQTIYTTKDVKINTGLSDSLFLFEIPPDVEVVDLRTAP